MVTVSCRVNSVSVLKLRTFQYQRRGHLSEYGGKDRFRVAAFTELPIFRLKTILCITLGVPRALLVIHLPTP